MPERRPPVGSDAWFKELENRLYTVGTQLADAAVLLARSAQSRGEVDRHLAIVQDLVARIEDRLHRVTADAGGVTPGSEVLTLDGAVLYRDVPDFPGYRVGSDGSVWGSRSAGRGYGRTREWRRLKPYLVRPGPMYTVSLYRDRARHVAHVHALVLLAFVGACPEGYEVEHTNGDALDNRRANLRYAPRASESC